MADDFFVPARLCKNTITVGFREEAKPWPTSYKLNEERSDKSISRVYCSAKSFRAASAHLPEEDIQHRWDLFKRRILLGNGWGRCRIVLAALSDGHA